MKPNWFVGFPVRSDALTHLYEGAPIGLNSFDLADLHITIAFFGAVSSELALSVWGNHEFALHARDVEFGTAQLFGSHSRATALGLNVDVVVDGGVRTQQAASEAYRESIRRDRDALLAAAGRPPDIRDVRLHVTVARLPKGLTSLQRRTAMRWADRINVEKKIALDSIALFTWADDRKLRRFKVVEERALPG